MDKKNRKSAKIEFRNKKEIAEFRSDVIQRKIMDQVEEILKLEKISPILQNNSVFQTVLYPSYSLLKNV